MRREARNDIVAEVRRGLCIEIAAEAFDFGIGRPILAFGDALNAFGLDRAAVARCAGLERPVTAPTRTPAASIALLAIAFFPLALRRGLGIDVFGAAFRETAELRDDGQSVVGRLRGVGADAGRLAIAAVAAASAPPTALAANIALLAIFACAFGLDFFVLDLLEDLLFERRRLERARRFWPDDLIDEAGRGLAAFESVIGGAGQAVVGRSTVTLTPKRCSRSRRWARF